MSSWRYQPRASGKPAFGIQYASQCSAVGTTSTRKPACSCCRRKPIAGRQKLACCVSLPSRDGTSNAYGTKLKANAAASENTTRRRGRKLARLAVRSMTGKMKALSRVQLSPSGDGTT